MLFKPAGGVVSQVEPAIAGPYECVAAAQLDKMKVLCLKYRLQWTHQYKDKKINKILAKHRI